MGAAYARVALGLSRARASACCRSARKRRKGNELTREAHQLLKQPPVQFIGNVEGRHVYAGDADVIVCDGFTGNVDAEDERGAGRDGGAVAARGAFRARSAREWATCCRARRSGDSASVVDYSEYGGAPLLGVNGLCIVGHGRSSPKAVRNAVAMAARFVRGASLPGAAARSERRELVRES